MRRLRFLTLCIAALGCLSVTLLASTAPTEAFGQAIFVIAGFALLWGVQIPTSLFYWKSVWWLYGVTFCGLLVTLFLGKLSHGAVRWLPIGPVHIQVSEIAKPVFALVLAAFIEHYTLATQKNILLYFLLIGGFFVPIFLQPDLGSALVILVTALVLLFISVKRLPMLIPWLVIGVVAIVGTWSFLLYPYQRDRLLSFAGTGNASYNARQALITVGSGKLFGRGLGHGVQSQLRFLPEYHTDFFFASLSEELGLTGVATVFILYGTFFYLIASSVSRASTGTQLFIIGFLAAFFFQAAVHIGMNMRLFPITGIPLPFLSSGGSSFLSLCIGSGVALRLLRE
ncbi:hypothetical protein C5B42_05985 [Candidatus Cerribacteria bacterium 'Amazon FNV 2010 28 9']|uniref:Rod shape-determining protein RodA n=1 Tax=Candidatus Cerribacteria bacterium 'Amazon FNV 2010 28 9' TaxID=2081795 RepID=A0A317JPI3_9BACT|nr:MAG: hypothetical protein C5B42_05985 [Candidatus Cerribacteria bacterium 'Amazon FNV 2010 28 9']